MPYSCRFIVSPGPALEAKLTRPGNRFTALYAAIGITTLSALAGCFFASCTIALRLVNRKKLADAAENFDADAFHKDQPRLMLTCATLRSGLTLLLVLSTLVAVQGQMPTERLDYVVAFFIALLLVSIFIVAIPGAIAEHFAEQILSRTLGVLNVLTSLFAPLILILEGINLAARRMTGVNLLEKPGESELTDDVISTVEDRHEIEFNDEQKEMLEAVFELPLTNAGEIMTPRTDIEGIEIEDSLEVIREKILDYGHSRIPVYDDNLDDIRGVLYAKDLLAYVETEKVFDINDVLRNPFMIPESKSVSELLKEFKAEKIHIAIVLDEYGGTSGLITIEDILEEIVGDIHDEYEEEEEAPGLTRRKDKDGNLYVDVDGRMYIDDVNDALELNIPEDDDYETIAGFAIHLLGHIPTTDEVVYYENVKITVTEAERTHVTKIRLDIMTPEAIEAEQAELATAEGEK